MLRNIFYLILVSLGLTGCISQDQADVKMSKGCEAGINSLISPLKIENIKSKNYSDEQINGGLHRRINIKAVEKDGWLELDKEYSCLFMQEWGIFKSSHKALLVQVTIDGETIGNIDGHITGGFDNFIKLTRVTDEAMGQ